MDKRTEKKNKIIDASISLMHLNGYNGTSVKDITDAAGIPKGSFYNYFKDKEQYAVYALQYYFSVLLSDFIAILSDKNLAPLDRISEFFKVGVSCFAKEDKKLGCFVGNMSQEMGNVSEPIAETIAEILGRLEAKICDNLVEAQENKIFKSELNMQILANFIVSSWQGSLLMMKVAKDKKILENFQIVLNDVLLK